MLVRAPDRIRKVVAVANYSDVLVSVVREVVQPEERVALNKVLAPEFDVHMLALLIFGQQVRSNRDGLTVKVFPQRDTCKCKERRHNVSVRGWNGLHSALWHARTANEEGDVDVFFDVAALTRRKTMLADVVAVVSRVDDISVIEH